MWKRVRQGDGWAVVNDETGEVAGTQLTEIEAQRRLATKQSEGTRKTKRGSLNVPFQYGGSEE